MRMARREFPTNNAAWVLTFADLVTLLLALFVLIFSMSSLDSSVLRSISAGLSRENTGSFGRGRIPANARLAAELVANVHNSHDYEGKIKELLFPRELLPPTIDKGTLEHNLRIEARKDGVVFVLANSLLFEPGTSRLTEQSAALLRLLAPLFEAAPGEVSISGYVPQDSRPGMPDEYEISARHALAVLGVFTHQHIDAARFGVSGYGADVPQDEPVNGEGPPLPAGRVEILLKTSQ